MISQHHTHTHTHKVDITDSGSERGKKWVKELEQCGKGLIVQLNKLTSLQKQGFRASVIMLVIYLFILSALIACGKIEGRGDFFLNCETVIQEALGSRTCERYYNKL